MIQFNLELAYNYLSQEDFNVHFQSANRVFQLIFFEHRWMQYPENADDLFPTAYAEVNRCCVAFKEGRICHEVFSQRVSSYIWVLSGYRNDMDQRL